MGMGRVREDTGSEPLTLPFLPHLGVLDVLTECTHNLHSPLPYSKALRPGTINRKLRFHLRFAFQSTQKLTVWEKTPVNTGGTIESEVSQPAVELKMGLQIPVPVKSYLHFFNYFFLKGREH